MNMPDDDDEEDDMRSVNLLALSSPDEKEAPSDDDSCTVDPTSTSTSTSTSTAPSADPATTQTTSSTHDNSFRHHHHHHPYDEPSQQQQQSPATQTLNTLSQSQESVDLLNYNSLSQLECDAVNALVLTKQRSHSHPQMQMMDSSGGARYHNKNNNNNNNNNHLDDSDSAASPEQKKLAARNNKKKLATTATASNTSTHSSNFNHRNAAASKKRAPSQHHHHPSEKKKKTRPGGVAVDQVDPRTGRTVATFATLAEAAAAAGCCYNVISQIAKGTHRAGVYQGWTYRYASPQDDGDDDDDEEEEENGQSSEDENAQEQETAPWPSQQQQSQDTTGQHGRAIAVQQVDLRTGRVVQTFATLSQAARVVGCSRHVVTDLVRGNSRHDSYQGRYTFQYAGTTVTTGTAVAEGSSVAASTHRSGSNKGKTKAATAVTRKKAPPPPPLPTTATKKKRSRSTSTGDDSPTTSSSRSSISVEQVDATTGRRVKIHASLTAAGESVGCSRWKIKELVDTCEDGGEYDGYIFRYASSSSFTSNKRRKIAQTTTISNKEKKGGITASIPVEQIDIRTGAVVQTYSSLTAASNGTGVRRRDITNIVRGKAEETAIKGWTFRYASGYDGAGADRQESTTTTAFSKSQLSQLSQQPAVQRQPSNARPIHELDAATQRVVRTYSKISDGIKATGIKSATMYKILRGDLAEWKGKTFRYCDNNSNSSSETTLGETTPSNAVKQEESSAEDRETIPRVSCAKTPPHNNILLRHNPSDDNAASSPAEREGESALRRASKLQNAAPDKDVSSPCSLLLELARGSVHQQQQHEQQQESPAKPSAIPKNKEEKCTKAGRRLTVSRDQKDPQDPSSSASKEVAGCSSTAPAKVSVKRESSSASPRSGSIEDSANGTADAKGTIEASKNKSSSSPLPCAGTKREESNDVFETLTCTVIKEGPLGIRILPTKPPEELILFLRNREYLKETDEVPPKILNLRGLHSPSIGGDAGMQKDDWLLIPSSEAGMRIDSRQVKTIVKEGGRPINFLLVRSLQDEDAAKEKISPSDGLQKNNVEDGDTGPGRSEHTKDSTSSNDKGTGGSLNNAKDDSVSKQASDQHVTEQLLAFPPSKTLNASQSPSPAKASESDLLPVQKETAAVPKEKAKASRSMTSKETATKNLPTKQTVASATTVKVKQAPQPPQSTSSQTKNTISTKPAVFPSNNPKPALVSLPKESGAKNASVAEQAVSAAPSKPRVSRRSQSLSSKKNKSGSSKPSDVVPFCALCNDDPTARPVHHAWCPNNPKFDQSGAPAIMLRLKRGIHELGCRGCTEEYQTGIVKPEKDHSKQCLWKKKQDLGDDEERSQSSVLSQLDDDDDDDGSFFASPGKPGKRFMKLELVKPVSSSQFVDKSAASLAVASTSAPSNVAESSKNTRQSSQAKSKASLPPPKEPLRMQSPVLESDIDQTSDEEDINEKLKVEWVAVAANFWGPSGHLDDDVVVFRSDPDPVVLVQNHGIVPVRYEMDLFSPTKARYRRTHTAPEDGFQTIVLTRDFAGQRPWGFTIERHFGGACLVSTVDPLSPAGGAVFVGSRKKAPLRVNDLLVLVNSKTVGGMTAERLEFELATSGAELILTISRYQFRALKSDETVNDVSRLGWTEIGGGNLTVDSPSNEKAGATEILSPSGKQHNNCTPVLDNSEVAENKSKEIEPKITSFHSKEKENERELSPGGDAEINDDSQLDTPRAGSPDSSQEGKPPAEKYDQDSTMGDDLPTLKSSPLRFKLAEQDDQHSVSLPSSPDTTVLGKGLEDDEDEADDGNAWYGCVCGRLHSDMVPVFWIQCDGCKTWYSAASECVGFSAAAAKYVEHWTCWGCPDISKVAGETKTKPPAPLPSPPSLQSPDTASSSEARHDARSSTKSPLLPSPDTASPKKTHTSIERRTLPTKSDDETETNDEELPQEEQKEIQPFKRGDFVFVEEHAWPGVDNPEGIAKILSAAVDPEVGNVYDIKYVVGNKHRGVLHQFMTPHHF